MYTVQAQATAPNGVQAEWYDYETLTPYKETAEGECDVLNRDHSTIEIGSAVWDILWVVVEYDNEKEYGCDQCGEYVPNGSGHYIEDDRVCERCDKGHKGKA